MCDGRSDTALDLLPDVDPGTISKFISVKELHSLCYSIIHIEKGVHPQKEELLELNLSGIIFFDFLILLLFLSAS